MGGVIGGLIPFILNYHRGDNAASVNDGTYIGFMVFMSIGTYPICFLGVFIIYFKSNALEKLLSSIGHRHGWANTFLHPSRILMGLCIKCMNSIEMCGQEKC